MALNETVLEMHFHNALIALIRDAFGLGQSGHYNFYKYTPQQECFVGFDQAFVKTQLTDKELFKRLSAAAATNGYALGRSYVGYFLQFKVVSRMVRFNTKTKTPPQVKATPFFRADVYNQRAKSSSHSQHELLYNLAKNKGAMTYYACPMVFSKEDLYKPADLSKLSLVDVSTAPSAFQDNQSHHIFFPTESGDPVWCSDPVAGSALSAEEFAKVAVERARGDGNSAQVILDALSWLKEVARSSDARWTGAYGEFDDFLANTLTVVEIPH